MRLRAILASALVLAFARGTVAADNSAASKHTSAYNYAGRVTFTVQGVAEGAVEDFPVYIRVSETAIPGFSYDFLRNGTNDLVFLDSSGRSLDYEMVKWDINGESDFWVKVPRVHDGATVTMCWNLCDGCTKPTLGDATAVWSDYVGVWHMDEEITAAMAMATNVSADVTGHGYCITPKKGSNGDLARTVSTNGVFGNARVNDTNASGGKNGNGLFISGSETFQFDGVFTLSFWIKFDSHEHNWPQLVSGRYDKDSSAGVQVDMDGSDRKKIVVRGDGGGGTYTQVVDKDFKQMDFVHLAFVYNGSNAKAYSDGVLKIEETVTPVTTNRLMLGNNFVCGEQSVYGKYDEVRLYRGVKSAAWIAAEHALGTNGLIFATAVTNDTAAVLKNEWESEPSITKTTWEYGTRPQWEDFNIKPRHGTLDDVTVVIYDRSTGEEIGRGTGWDFDSVIPTAPGSYRVEIAVAEQDGWGALEYSLDFRIVTNAGSHGFEGGEARILLGNDDYSVAGGEVEYQSYDDEYADLGIPYWEHLDSDGKDASTTHSDYWSDSYEFNLGGGTHHIYRHGEDTNGWWNLRNVRIGNTFSNGELLEEWSGKIEKDDEGLAKVQNYLPWNPDAQGVLGYVTGEPVGPYHRYAGHLVMQNTKDAAVVSPCYTNGIGTIYFDAVNGWTDNVYDEDGNPNYQLVVEVATKTEPDKFGQVHDPLVEYTSTNPGLGIGGAYDPWYYAVWEKVPVHVLRFAGGVCTDLGEQPALTLDVADGGSYTNFYRVYVPVTNAPHNARFRIRRAAIDPLCEYNPDGCAYVLIDNVICSSPTLKVELGPYGKNFTVKTGKQVLGCEGAFSPAFPSVTDTAVYGRARATVDGKPAAAGIVTSAAMHYRWHYLNQKATDWMVADLNPATFETWKPLNLPALQGDVDFWFDANQSGNYYEYSDYSGTGLGLAGTYSEAIPSVTNGLDGADWFVRLREGKSDIAEMKVVIRGSAQPVDMYLSEDHLWRGFLPTTNVIEDGIYWRIEPRNRQTDGAKEWNWSTNYWYVTEWDKSSAKLPDFPAAGRLSEGTTNSWSRMPSKKDTGYLMFQVDESSLGVTVIRADYQNFNDWNDARGDYFVGSFSTTNEMRGTSAKVRTYDEKYAGWADTVATNKNWELHFDDQIGQGIYDGYKTFSKVEDYFRAWQVGKGMWVYGKYREPKSNVALQMAGNGEGYVEFSNVDLISEWPRGIGSVSFKARIAQAISPEYGSYFDDGKRLTNYTFMARTCFDMNNNMNFSGNAALSLFAYYRADEGAYEARWEQISGKDNSGSAYKYQAFEPEPRGQRLVISRWNFADNQYKETVLFAVTNSVSFNSGKGFVMPTMPYDGPATNNLMPFCISVFKEKGTNIIVAAVRVAEETQDVSKNKQGGVSWDKGTASLGDNWYFAFACDGSSKKLRGGTYGVLSSNCEGMFITPQFRKSATYPSDVKPADMLKNKSGFYSKKALNSTTGFLNCWNDLPWWEVHTGRMRSFWDDDYGISAPFGLTYAVPRQTVDICMAPKDSGSFGDPIASVEVTDFGKPGREPDCITNLYYTSDCRVRLQTGGGLDDYPVDVAVSDIVLSQWRGEDNWSSKEKESTAKQAEYGRTNIIFTSGWVTNGAVRLSAKRTEEDVACSVRSPLFDGVGGRAVGLGMIGFTYRKPETSLPVDTVLLKVQICTNYTSGSGTSLKDMSQTVEEGSGNRSWRTITNLTYRTLLANYDAELGLGSWRTGSEFGLHGAKGLMRVVVDPNLVEAVQGETDTGKFGEIDIVEVVCKNEPSLDAGCWWGWNMLTLGDIADSQNRMYLPDCPRDKSQSDVGQSLALNNSVSADISPTESAQDMAKHMPFVQSPTFTNAVIGQISFKARKYDLSDRAPNAQVVVYGATKKDLNECLADTNWTYVTHFAITNTVYENFTCKTDSQNFYALRLAVVDVDGTPARPEQPPKGDAPQRVLIDEVAVSEAVRAMLSFRNVGAFRSHLDDNTYVPGVTTKDEQPLCDENWGVQAELYATMLGDEIYKGFTPRVKLHWYVGKEPWGYANWKKMETGSAWLAQTEGSNYVYRSSYTDAPNAVMPAQTVPGTVVQYMLEVEYMILNSTKKESEPVLTTNWLDSASWALPDWYAPVDYNNDPDYGAGSTFAAFNILDSVAPGWAWINEVNVFGTKSDTGANSDEQFQYVEVCVPLEADLTGWRLRMLEAGVYTDTVTTNWIANFGKTIWDQASGTKATPTKYNKTFRCLGNKESGQLRKDNGSLDGIWQFSEYSSTFRNRDGVDCVYDIEQPFGIQLVRPSGIIESSIVVVGTNRWGRMPGYREYDPTNVVARLNQLVPGSKFFYAAEDCRGTFRSGSVTSGQGESASVWTNSWACSPGYINTNWGGKVEQKIEPDHPTPHGDSIIIYTTVDQSGGPIRQWVGKKGSSQTNSTEMIILKRGSARGTNIVYQVDPWYEISSITTNGAAFWPYVPRVREYEATVGKGASNGFTVVAKAGVDSDLRDKYGLTEDNAFTPAVMDWLVGGKDAYGREFVNNGEIALADYANIRGEIVTNLTLTQMYCLDMDPTVSNLVFQAGMLKAWPVVAGVDPEASVTSGYKGTAGLTNTRMRVFMMITNRNETVAAGYDRAWSPYILRGLNPGSTSWGYESGGVIAQSWTGATFKVTGILANGLTHEDNYDNWIPLRWFVFHEDSFFQPGNPEGHDPYTTDIEIVDPHSISSPGAAAGWYEWCREHGYAPIFNRWAIDLRMKPVEVEVLKQENFFE